MTHQQFENKAHLLFERYMKPVEKIKLKIEKIMNQVDLDLLKQLKA